MTAATPAPRTVAQRIWDDHVVAEFDGGHALLHIDRVFLHERTGPAVLAALADAGRAPRHRDRVFGVVDHTVDTRPARGDGPSGRDGDCRDGSDSGAVDEAAGANPFVVAFRRRTRDAGIELLDLHDPRQGIVHVVSPEQGLALPGCTLVCPDSHTGTVGGIGALAWGIGSTEGEHAVATQTLVRAPAPQLRVVCDGRLPAGVFAKDLALALIARFGAGGGAVDGAGAAVEYAGAAVRALDVEGRMTLCNLAVEFGAWTGLVAPDDTTIDWVAGRPHAPRGARWDAAVAHWRTLRSSDDARWDRELHLDASALAPQLSWGTSPGHTVAVDAAVPDPARARDAAEREAWTRALAYMALRPGQPLAGTPIDAAFIGSCTNARLPDLRAAAAVLRGRRVAAGVVAWCVPGSMAVRAAAEAEGLHRVFEDAGFEWRTSGCSLCFFAGGDSFGFGAGSTRRVVSSTNRNFEGRQGPGVRTHLASPATVAASALAGCLADPRPALAAALAPTVVR